MAVSKSDCPVCEEQKARLHPVGENWRCPTCGAEYVSVFWDVPERLTQPYNQN
jgi:hypothetical protein